VRYDIPDLIQPSEDAMQWLVLGATYILLVLFLIGVINLLVGLYELVTSGNFTDPTEVILLLDTVLVLLIIVEVHRTLLAYARQEPVIQIVVGAGIVAVAREVISFRVEDFSGRSECARRCRLARGPDCDTRRGVLYCPPNRTDGCRTVVRHSERRRCRLFSTRHTRPRHCGETKPTSAGGANRHR
jgi:Predicted membrane protein